MELCVLSTSSLFKELHFLNDAYYYLVFVGNQYSSLQDIFSSRDSKVYLIQYSVTQHKLPAYDPRLWAES